MKNRKYTLPGPLAATFYHDGEPDLETLEELVINAAMVDSGDQSEGMVKALLSAYIAKATAMCDDDDTIGELTLVSQDGDFTAEMLYRKYAILGYRHCMASLGRKEYVDSLNDNDVYERCEWYEYDSRIHWPDFLLVKVAYIRGTKDASHAVAMAKYFEENKKAG